MTRTQLILAALLAVQVLALVLTWGSGLGSGGAGEASALFPELAAGEPVRIAIVDPGTEGSEGEQLVLERGEQGWALPDKEGFPIDEERIGDLVESLETIRVRVPVVRQSRHHESFQVAEGNHQRKLRLWVDEASGEPDAELLVGSSPNYRRTNVRRADGDEVYEVRGLGSYDLRTDPGAWIDKSFVTVPYEQIRQVALENGQGRLSLRREGEDWVVDGASAEEAFDREKLESWVRSASSLWFDQPVGAADPATHGFDRPRATLTLSYAEEAEPGTTEALQTVRLIVGKAVPGAETSAYATRDGYGFTVTLGSIDVGRIVEQTREDWLPDPAGSKVDALAP
ncbi:hypothetical protein ABI59_00870 [Acidobacteria bacterium Mor1]|nr:hypothetical protein ABI59_00870 [Acidobacteria bacterium Mor1]